MDGYAESYAKYINFQLRDDTFLKNSGHLPLTTANLVEKCKDGILICKLINKIQEETIDERTITTKIKKDRDMVDNLTLAINSAGACGCRVNKVTPEQIFGGDKETTMKFLWEIIYASAAGQIDIDNRRGILTLKTDEEDDEHMRRLSKDEVLVRWVKWLLKSTELTLATTSKGKLNTDQLKDCTVYYRMLKVIAVMRAQREGQPDNTYIVNTSGLDEPDLKKRAAKMLASTNELGLCAFPLPEHIASGDYDMHFTFMAHMFQYFPPPPEK